MIAKHRLLNDPARTKAKREDNKRLLSIIKTGTQEEIERARDELAVQNMPLVTVKVEAHIKEFPQDEYLRNDLTGAGLLALVQASKTVGNMTGTNVTGYLSQPIVRSIRDFSQESAPIFVPVGSKSRHKRDKRKVVVPLVRPFQECGDHIRNDADLPDIGNRIEDTGIRAYQRAAELFETILAACANEQELEIVTLLSQELDLAQVADRVGLGYEQVRYIRDKIHQRLIDAGDLQPKPRRQSRKRPETLRQAA